MARSNPEYWRNYYRTHREQRLAESSEYQKKHREVRVAYNRAYYAKNRERLREQNRAYRQQHSIEVKERRREDYRRNAERYKASVKAWQAANPVKRRAQRLRAYDLTIEQYDAILLAQGGACAICHQVVPIGGRNGFHIDHDHVDGHVRGILCASCNLVLGKFNDDPVRFREAAAYLERAMVGLVRPE
jgi:hypothetical protein